MSRPGTFAGKDPHLLGPAASAVTVAVGTGPGRAVLENRRCE